MRFEVQDITLCRNGQLRGFASIIIDGCLVVHDLRIIESRGRLLVSMPSRKRMEHCPSCRAKNPITARFCNECGGALGFQIAESDTIFFDVAHPITAQCRNDLERAVLEAYRGY